MKKIAALTLIALLPLGAQAGIIIDNTTGGWYNSSLGDMEGSDGHPGGFFLGANVSEGDPTLSFPTQPAFVTPAALGANWLSGSYNANWSLVADIPDTWAVNEETAIVYGFNLASASSLHIDLGVDNGILVWLDGNYVFGAQAGGGSSLGEYDIDVASLAAGNHRLQIIREDHGGATGYDIQVDATAVRVPVPEPATLALLGMGLLGLGAARRRRS
jgi:PEP-CTERM motif